MQSFELAPIGFIQSCFEEKFGVPRQSGMISQSQGILKLNANSDFSLALNELSTFSHLWIVYIFHKNIEKGWKPHIEAPRLDAPKKVGVFASRSPHRPNPVGLSAVKIEKIDSEAPGGAEIHFSGHDILNGTPVLDIKPYLPFADRIDDANAGWAQGEIQKYPVSFSEESLRVLQAIPTTLHPDPLALVTEILELDPRPTSQRKAKAINDPLQEGSPFAFRFLNYDVKWQIQNQGVHVTQVLALP